MHTDRCLRWKFRGDLFAEVDSSFSVPFTCIKFSIQFSSCTSSRPNNSPWLRHAFPTSFMPPTLRTTGRVLVSAVSPAVREEMASSVNMESLWRDKHLGRGRRIWAGKSTAKQRHRLYLIIDTIKFIQAGDYFPNHDLFITLYCFFMSYLISRRLPSNLVETLHYVLHNSSSWLTCNPFLLVRISG